MDSPAMDEDQLVNMHSNFVSNVSGLDCPGTRYGIDDSFDLGRFQKSCRVQMTKLNPLEMEFDLIGVDASIANALRRIMYAEVPTMAIEKVFLSYNDGVISDEILSHRIGLVPIKVDPRHFQSFTNDDACTDLNTLVFQLTAEQTAKSLQGAESRRLLSSALQWVPQGNQLERLAKPVAELDADTFPGLEKIRKAFAPFWAQRALPPAARKQKQQASTMGGVTRRSTLTKSAGKTSSDVKELEPRLVYPVYEDIVIAKLNPGHTLHCQLHAIKHVGREHAKWTPVELANYRLLPHILLTEPITGPDAVRFQQCFEPGVISLKTDAQTGEPVAVVENPRNCGMNRECLRYPEFQGKVRLARVRDHFMFRVQSVGQYDSPAEIFMEACKVLLRKCQVLKEAAELLQGQDAVAAGK